MPSVSTDEIVERAKNEWFSPTEPLRDETEGERFRRIVKQAITAALQSAPVSRERERCVVCGEPRLLVCGECVKAQYADALRIPHSLRSKPDFYSDPVEQLAFELAFELEEADLKPDDLVTVNREKLRAIAKRIFYRLTAVQETATRAEAAETSLAAANERVKKLAAGIEAVHTLIDYSEGVTGLHKNGDVAPWNEIRTGGRFEEWLYDFDCAYLETCALKTAAQEEK